MHSTGLWSPPIKRPIKIGGFIGRALRLFAHARTCRIGATISIIDHNRFIMIAGSTREQLSAKYVRLPIDRSDTSQVTGLHRSDRAQSGGTPIVLLGEVAPMHTSTHACSARTAYFAMLFKCFGVKGAQRKRCLRVEPDLLLGGQTPVNRPVSNRSHRGNRGNTDYVTEG